MSKSAVICELNPLTLGHKRLFDEIRRNGDDLVVLMSGNFVERGEVAVLDKYLRARHAIMCGADLALELPTCFALAPAQNFASGAVMLLDKLKVDKLWFGSECGDIERLSRLSELSSDTVNFSDKTQSYPKARYSALKNKISKDDFDALDKPNNILAIEYLRALKTQKSIISPITIKRDDLGYNSQIASETHASASAVRKAYFDGAIESVKTCIPTCVFKTLKNTPPRDHSESLLKLLQFVNSTISINELKNTAECIDGLENNIAKNSKTAKSYDELLASVKSKRYTMSRIKRLLLNELLGIDKELFQFALNNQNYANLLALRKGKEYLLDSPLPIVFSKSDEVVLDKNNLYLKSMQERFDDVYRILNERYVKPSNISEIKV